MKLKFKKKARDKGYNDSKLSKSKYRKYQKLYLKNNRKDFWNELNPKTRFKKYVAIDNWTRGGLYKPKLSANGKVSYDINKDNVYYKLRKKIIKSTNPLNAHKLLATVGTLAALGITGKYIIDARRQNKAISYDRYTTLDKLNPVIKYHNPYLKANERISHGNVVRR